MNKINKSRVLFKEAQKHMPGGVNSPVRAFKNINPKFRCKMLKLCPVKRSLDIQNGDCFS